jgi:hypothetical protein
MIVVLVSCKEFSFIPGALLGQILVGRSQSRKRLHGELCLFLAFMSDK